MTLDPSFMWTAFPKSIQSITDYTDDYVCFCHLWSIHRNGGGIMSYLSNTWIVSTFYRLRDFYTRYTDVDAFVDHLFWLTDSDR